jgi:small subunit ribosomal protein S4e
MGKRGDIKHLKRVNAPKHWMLSKVGGIWATKPSQGPHKLRECVPMTVLLRNKMKLALTNKEARTIVLSDDGNIAVDGVIRKDPKFPIGFMDVVSVVKTNTHYRLLYDVKGRFGLKKISPTEAEYKLCKVKRRIMGPKNVPFIVTHDGRTIRFPHPNIKQSDSIKLNLKTKTIEDFYKFNIGARVLITGGNNTGRIGNIVKFEKHPGSYEIIHVKDGQGNVFSTRSGNVFVIGKDKDEVSLLKNHQYLSIIEERKIAGERMKFCNKQDYDEDEEVEET